MKQLTEKAELEREEWMREYRGGNCSCHICAPCGCCLHPGNPANQDEDQEAWEEVPE